MAWSPFLAALALVIAPPAPPQDGLHVGFGAADITPDLGRHVAWMAGYRNDYRATGVHDPLWARAVVLDDGANRIALVSVDLVGLQRDAVERVRAQLPDYLHVLVSSTHTHEGPDVIGLWGPSPAESGVDTAYVSFVVERVVAAVRAAESDVAAASAVYGTAEAPAHLIRDSRLPVARDSIVRVLRFDDASGEPRGLLVQFSNHPESLGAENPLITADFPYYTIQALEARYGVPVAYFSGAIGGLMTHPETFTAPDGTVHESGTWDYAAAYGDAVARVVDDAVADADPITLTPLAAYATPVFIPLANPGYRMGRALGVLNRDAYTWLGRADSAGPSVPPSQVEGAIAIETEVTYLRAGELHVAGIPGELYPELVYGTYQSPPEPHADFPDAPLEPTVMEALPDAKMLILGLANDEVGYIIPKRQWDDEAPYAYGFDDGQYGERNSVGPDVAALLMEALRGLVREASTP
jgi:hypothetical protein